ncbi:MAG: hypothetical protein AUJ49_05040 [Desulfovibrionaceae bacterium CG1_02_65_16]|nr:MAG: hypothetical protein AUJ49_05040 [Desulfovibrionaceae bacterium CG1_02_65_16]
MATIAEPAVYKLAFRSNKPEADAFTNWVASEVLPAIRKTGQYAAKPAAQGQLTPEQCRHLHDVMDAKVCTRPKDSRRAAYAEAWTRFNRHFRIAKYDQLPQAKYVEALSYIIVMDLKAAQKALPAGNLVSLVDKDAVQRLVSQARAHGGDMHNDVTELWNMIWRDVETWKYPERPMALCQLRYTADEAFRVLGANIECIRCLVRTIDVTYREMRKMAAL